MKRTNDALSEKAPPPRGRGRGLGAARLGALAATLASLAMLMVALVAPARASAEADVVETLPMMARAGGQAYEQVTDEGQFFNSGAYLNQIGQDNDPPFSASDFEVHGGRMVEVGRSVGNDPKDIYHESNIWPRLVMPDGDRVDAVGPKAWAFVADGTYSDAEGAYVSMTYREVGTLEDSADPDADGRSGRLVDVKVTYKIQQAAMPGHEQSYNPAYKYDGRPVVQLTDNFSYGVFQFGIVDLATTFEFLDHDTGKALQFESVYFTETSQDKGEGVAMEQSQILSKDGHPGVWLSGNAWPTKSHDNVGEAYRFDVPQGSLVYDGSPTGKNLWHDMVTFLGAPNVHNASGAYSKPPEYQDTIGDPTYYWRSACYLLNMDKGASATVHKIANGWTDWTGSFDLPDPNGWDNGGMMYSTHNFRPLTNPKPKAPQKTITAGQVVRGKNGPDDPVRGIGIGDTVRYEVSQRIHQVGVAGDGLVRYNSMTFSDALPEWVRAKVDSVKVIAVPKNESRPDDRWAIDASSYDVSYDEGTNTLTVSIKKDWLQGGMVYDGGHYVLAFDVEVTDQPADDEQTVDNDATVTINDAPQTTNTVSYLPIHPTLTIEKHAVLDYKDASSVNEYEYLNHDEDNPYSTVHYSASMANVVDKTRAHDVTIMDDLAPGLKLVPGSVKVSGVDKYTVHEDPDPEKGFTIAIPSLDPLADGNQVRFEYDCRTTTKGNGKEVVNTAETWAPNVKEGERGSLGNHAADDGEVYVNDPNLVVTKTVTESPVQNDDYQRGEEYRVGDTFTYQVTMTNTVDGTYAKDVRLTDDDMPAGFELAGPINVSGLTQDGKSFEINYPISGESDTIHGEMEKRTIQWQQTDVKKPDGTWGWNVDVNILPWNTAVTVTWTVRATQETNGWEVYNRARATARNQPNDTFWSTDGRTGDDYTVVWVNTPEFQVDKDVRATNGTYQVGDPAAYDVTLGPLKTPGTLARETTLDDRFETTGTTIVDGSFVVVDREDRQVDFREQVELNRYVDTQGWKVDMRQAYGDQTGYWLAREDFRYEFKDGALSKVEGQRNPVDVKGWHDAHAHEKGSASDSDKPGPEGKAYGNDWFRVHYEATVNDHALENDLIKNIATADSKEQFPVQDEADISVTGAALLLDKDSTQKSPFSAGDVATYTLTITNNNTNTTARQVVVSDGFTTAKAGAVSIVDGSMRIRDNKGNEIPERSDATPDGWEVTWRDNESGTHVGFEVATHRDLSSNERLVVTYDVKYLTNNGSSRLLNVAHAWAENAPKVQDDYEIWPSDADQSDLIIDKGSDKTVYKPDDVATYYLHVTNGSDRTATNVVIDDEFDKATIGICHVVKGTVKVTDERGNAVSGRVTYKQATSGQIYGFTIETGHDLTPDEAMDVTYQVRFEKGAQKSNVNNHCWAAADNTGKATDDYEVTVDPEGTPPPPETERPPATPEEPGEEDEDEPKLAIQKDSNRMYFRPGDTGRYTLLVTNVGTGVAKNVKVTDSLDADALAHAEIVKGSVAVKDAMGGAVDVRSVGYDQNSSDGRVSGFSVDTGYDLERGGNLTITYDVRFSGEISGETPVHNKATATGDNAPPAETDHEVTLDTKGHPEIDVEKRVDKQVVAPGDRLAYTLDVSELTEGLVAKGVVVTDVLPEGYELDQGSIVVTKDNQQVTADVSFPKGRLQVRLGDVAYGERWQISLAGVVREDFKGDVLLNKVQVDAENVPRSPQDEVETPVVRPRLEIEKQADKELVVPGDSLTYTVLVRQTQEGAVAKDVKLTDTLPKGFVIDKGSLSIERDRSSQDISASFPDGGIEVDLGDVSYGEEWTVRYSGTVETGFEGTELVNKVRAESPNVEDTPEDSVTVPIAEREITLEKQADASSVGPGGIVHYVLRVTAGDAPLSGVVVTDEVPAGISLDEGSVRTYLNDAGVDMARSFEAGRLTVQVGALSASDVLRVEYDARVDEGVAPGTDLVNVARVTADGLDPVEARAIVTVPGSEPGVPPTVDEVGTTTKSGKRLAQTGVGIVSWVGAIAGFVAICAGCAWVWHRMRG